MLRIVWVANSIFVLTEPQGNYKAIMEDRIEFVMKNYTNGLRNTTAVEPVISIKVP